MAGHAMDKYDVFFTSDPKTSMWYHSDLTQMIGGTAVTIGGGGT